MPAKTTSKPVRQKRGSVGPFVLQKLLWPDVTFYDKQREVIESVWRDDETYVPAGNMLGKDFVAGYCALAFFLSHQPCRVVTTSVRDDHLRVLWGEIKRFIQTMKVEPSQNSRLIVNYREIRRYVDGLEDPISYLHGTVSERGEGMAGHHAAYTLLIIDEASGVDDDVYNFGDTWSQHKLIIGNPNPCTNFFYTGVKAGDYPKDPENPEQGYYRKIIKISALDSPNVKLGIAQKETDKPISDEELIPGVIGYNEYKRRRAIWDKQRQCIGLDGEFYEGEEVLLYPPEWLNRSVERAELLQKEVEQGERLRKAKTMGVDSGEGDAESCWAIGDDLGLIKLVAIKTADTTKVASQTVQLMREYQLPPENVYFDRGGGGKQHADYLRERGYPVKTVAFGESVKPKPSTGYVPQKEKTLATETRYAYVNRRSQMYGMLRLRMDPSKTDEPYAIPKEYKELRRQLSLIPLEYDKEGRLILPSKSKKASARKDTQSLTSILGRSPDHADALVLQVYGLEQDPIVILGPAF